jgi:hypothetical protein
MTISDRSFVQELLDATEAGDYDPVFESFAENIIVENGPPCGSGRRDSKPRPSPWQGV